MQYEGKYIIIAFLVC